MSGRMASPYSLTLRLVLVLATLSFFVMGLVGAALYNVLAMQLTARDDAALVTRVEQIRTLLKDSNTLELIHNKPKLFANMLDNRESLLVLRYPGKPPLIEVNPAGTRIPKPAPVGIDTPLTLQAVAHSRDTDGVPLSAVAALARCNSSDSPLEITAARTMYDRTRLLKLYRERIFVLAAAGALIFAALGYLLLRRGLLPLRQLAAHADAVNIANLHGRLGHRHMPRELMPLVMAFNSMLERLSDGFTQLRQVSADLAHDLRTPVNNLLGQTQVALGRPRSVEEYETLLASNVEELERLMRMSDNMLFLARSEHAQMQADIQPLPLADEMARVAEYFEGPAEERNLQISVSGGGIVLADPILLRRALGNLLANAVHYANGGSLITLSAQTTAQEVTITVENHGPTIAPEHLERLFDRFYRVDPARTGATQSSGLGLSIVRSIMQLHGGNWQVTSADGITRFAVSFPAQNDPRSA